MTAPTALPTGSPHLTLVLGGARSGKSAFAELLVSAAASPIYIATAEAGDAEMSARIAAHRARRGPGWQTIEAPIDLADALSAASSSGTAILVDSVSLWIANLLGRGADCDSAFARLEQLLAAPSVPVTMVADEVGLGIVPDNALARLFRDHAGSLNQRLARLAVSVILVTAGLPLVLKGGLPDRQSFMARTAPALAGE